MSSLSAFFVAAVTGALGLLVTGVVTTVLNDWFHLYNSKDVGGGLVTVIIAVLGGVLFFVLGLVVSRAGADQPEPGFLRALGISCGIVVAAGGVVLFVGWLRADSAPNIDGQAIELAVEVRAPVGFSLPANIAESDAIVGVRANDGRVQLFGNLDLTHAQTVDGRWIFSALVPLHTSSPKKVMEVRVGEGNDFTFGLPSSGRPSRTDMKWSPWLDADRDAGQAEPPPEKQFNLRYRVQLVRPSR